ncbi:MAG TPA: hypothetical protein VF230_08600 [Acidimicrobiales bacterium]
MTARLAVVTNAESTELYSDGEHLLPALARAGFEVDVVGWRSTVDWGEYDGVLVRNTWDYIDDREAFVAWARSVAAATRLANPADVLEWNTDKRYLAELERAGVPCIPTLWIESGGRLDAPPSWNRFVVKPAVSAGGRSSASYTSDGAAAAAAHVDAIVRAGGVAMVQPHVESVDRVGELGIYVIGGAVTHAVRKGGILRTGAPAVDDFSLAQEQPSEPAEVTPELAAFARAVVAAVPGGGDRLLYARVDTVAGDGGETLLLELELVEPFLFLEHSPPAADAYAAAVTRWLRPRVP